MMMPAQFLSFLEKAMNRYLALDPESQTRLHKLQGKAIAIEFLPFHWLFQMVFTEEGIAVKSDETISTNTVLRGTPLQMASVMLAKDQRQRFFAEDVIIEGDAEFGQQVVALFDELYIDWEEYLAKVIGDTAAYNVGRFIRDVGGFVNKAQHSFTQNINEFVHEETEWLPTREALQDFFADIDELRMDVDRIEAKIKSISLPEEEVK